MAEELEGRIGEVEKSIGTLESQIRSQIGRTQAATRTVLVVGIIVIVVIFGYMTWLSGLVKDLAQPAELAETLVLTAVNQIPKAVEDIKASLKEQAPENVGRVREMLMEQVPILRGKAEEMAAMAVDRLVDQLNAKVDQVVKEVVTMHKKELEPLIKAAASDDPKDVAALEKAFTESLQQTIGPKLDEVMTEYDRAMIVLRYRLKRLAQPDAKLTIEEKFEKEAIISLMTFIQEAMEKGVIDPDAVTGAIIPKIE